MTPQERELLTKFLVDLNNTPAGLKDAEAAAMIDQAIRQRPDAAYVLVQHAIMSDQALHQAQAELSQLRAQVQPPQSQASFLGAQPAPQPASYAPAPSAMPGGLFGGGGGLGSFLRNAGTTAAGVVAGDMLFSSLSGLFGGHGGGWGGGFGGGYGGGGVENVVINNYNDDGGDYGGGGDDSGSWDDGN